MSNIVEASFFAGASDANIDSGSVYFADFDSDSVNSADIIPEVDSWEALLNDKPYADMEELLHDLPNGDMEELLHDLPNGWEGLLNDKPAYPDMEELPHDLPKVKSEHPPEAGINPVEGTLHVGYKELSSKDFISDLINQSKKKRRGEKIQHSTNLNKVDNLNRSLRVLLQKELQESDVGKLGRMVLPKKAAEDNLANLLSNDECITIKMEDFETPDIWHLRFKFWNNNKSRMYVLENTKKFVNLHGLEAGDHISIYEDVEGQKVIRAQKREKRRHWLSSGSGYPASEMHRGTTGEVAAKPTILHMETDEERAVEATATVMEEISDKVYRKVKDPFSYVWSFATPIKLAPYFGVDTIQHHCKRFTNLPL